MAPFKNRFGETYDPANGTNGHANGTNGHARHAGEGETVWQSQQMKDWLFAQSGRESEVGVKKDMTPSESIAKQKAEEQFALFQAKQRMAAEKKLEEMRVQAKEAQLQAPAEDNTAELVKEAVDQIVAEMQVQGRQLTYNDKLVFLARAILKRTVQPAEVGAVVAGVAAKGFAAEADLRAAIAKLQEGAQPGKSRVGKLIAVGLVGLGIVGAAMLLSRSGDLELPEPAPEDEEG